jgi:hypothetical protein
MRALSGSQWRLGGWITLINAKFATGKLILLLFHASTISSDLTG